MSLGNLTNLNSRCSENRITERRLKPSLTFSTLFFMVWVELNIDFHKTLLSEWELRHDMSNKCRIFWHRK